MLTCARSRPEEVVRRSRVDECAGGVRWVVGKLEGVEAGWEVPALWRIARPV